MLGEINPSSAITLSPNTLTKEEIRYGLKTSKQARKQIVTVNDLGSWDATGSDIKIKTTKVISTWYITKIYSTKRTFLDKYPLGNLDTIRDKILLTPGDTVFDISNETMSVAPLTNFAKKSYKRSY